MLIRVTTDKGITGYAPGPAHERAAREVRETIGPFLEGVDPQCWGEIDPGRLPATVEKTYRAVEIALMDIAGKAGGRPLSDIAGGRVRDSIKLYGSAGMYMAPERYAEEAAAVRAMGFPAYKMRPGLGSEGDLEAVERMRGATAPDFGLMIDAHTWWRMGDNSYDAETVTRLVESMKAYSPTWIEEPIPPEDHEAYRDLRKRTSVPIASGEHEPDDAGFLDLLDPLAVDYIQMDILCQGGLPTFNLVVDRAERLEIPFAFHSWGTTLEVLAAAHLGICRPEEIVEWLEYPCYANSGRVGMYPFPAADEILSAPLDIRDGWLHVSEEPGLGIDVDESVIERYPFLPGPWSTFRLDSPPTTVAVTGDHSVKWVEEKS